MLRSSTITATLVLRLACGQPDLGDPDTDTVGSTDATTTGAPTTSSGDDGSSNADDAATGDDPLSHDPACSRGLRWTKGDQGSPLMHPGVACLACHVKQGPEIAGRLSVAGTVYPIVHEPDDCYGVDDADAPIVVEISAADGRVVALPVGPSGNFFHDPEEQGDSIVFPITARVLQGDRVRAMASPQASGDCNGCHTQDGTAGAPGRILAP